MHIPDRLLWNRIVAWTISIAGMMLAFGGHVSLKTDNSTSSVNSIVIAGGVLCLIGLLVGMLRKIWAASVVGIVAAFLYIAILYIHSSTSTVDSFTIFVSLGLSVFVGGALSLLGNSVGQRKALWRMFHYVGITLIGFCVSVLLVSSTILNIQFTQTCRKGEGIIQAITRYDQDYSHYPDSLETLVPHYLPQIPPSSMRWGKETFRYWVPSTDNAMQPFYLSFQVDEQGCHYDLYEQHWLCGGS